MKKIFSRWNNIGILVLIATFFLGAATLAQDEDAPTNAERVAQQIEEARATGATRLSIRIDPNDGIPNELFTLTQLEYLSITTILGASFDANQLTLSEEIGNLVNLGKSSNNRYKYPSVAI